MTQRIALALGLLGLVGTSGAQRVTIETDNAPLRDVVQLLKQMNGVQIVGDNDPGIGGKLITLAAEDVPLKQVMREICRQAGCHFTRIGNGYHLLRGAEEEDKRPRMTLGDFEIAVNSVSVGRSLYRDLRQPDRGTRLSHQLLVELAAEADDDEQLIAVYGFHPDVIVTTDTGVQLESRQREMRSASRYGTEGVVHGNIQLSPPPEGARSISIEGDLVLYATLVKAEFEFALDEIDQTKTVGEMQATLQSLDPETGEAKCRLEMPEPKPEGANRNVEWVSPRFTVALLDADGHQANAHGSGWSGSSEEGMRRWDQRYTFSMGEGFVPAKLRLRVTLPSDPTERLTYFFEDVPLPLEEDVEVPPLP